MHAADTSLSVDQAADVAREAADFVLLEKDLGVLRRGIEEGRRTFANTLEYLLTTTSATWATCSAWRCSRRFYRSCRSWRGRSCSTISCPTSRRSAWPMTTSTRKWS